MRFLQIEWHNHERARNAWDIERAEMKAKIAKQEGEVRHTKKLNDQLERQIRMLELALKNERSKNRDKATSESAAKGEAQKDMSGVNGVQLEAGKSSKNAKRRLGSSNREGVADRLKPQIFSTIPFSTLVSNSQISQRYLWSDKSSIATSRDDTSRDVCKRFNTYSHRLLILHLRI